MNRGPRLNVVLACLCGFVLAAVLLLEDGTAMGSPGLTSVGAHVAVVAAVAVCLTAAARLFLAG